MSSDYLIGRVLGNRYEIIEKIGTGGMATVYKAKCRVLDRYVAIKILKDSLKYDPEVVKKFNTESRAAARLSHPNIVQVYDVSENGEFDYIVMEFVDGITLKEYIQNKGKLTEEQACDFAAQIGRALDCAHSNGIVHRDIKPHNVLITKDGIAKVADFGIAQATSSETLVAGSGAMGSVHYISPEQARGGFTNERSDIYSLGVVLYEMLTGKVPFDGANPVAVALAKLEQEPVDLRTVNSLISDSVADIAMKAISKEQHSRYQSVAAMVSDLEAVIGTASSPIIGEEDKFETKRLDNQQTKDEYTMRRTEKSRRRKKQTNARLVAGGVIIAVLLGIITYFAMSGGSKEYQVPDLTGMTIEEAEAALKEANLRLNENIEYEETDEVEEGLVIDQEPGINQYVKKNRKIKITVSATGEGGEKSIPDVENLKYEDAKERLEDAGFKCVMVEEFSETIQYGYVIRQSPKGGKPAERGAEVTIYVSGEEEQAVVPKITGDTESEARSKITAAGLSVGTVSATESDSTAGTVIAQNPVAGTGVEKGSKVNITISSGKAEAEQTPTPTPAATPTLKRKTLTINIPEGASESVNIKAVANGREIYNKNHARSEQTVDIPVQSSKDASVQVYIDGTLVADKIIQFD